MSNCIICNKEILGTQEMRLDVTHEAHIKCFYKLLPKPNLYATKEQDDVRDDKIEAIVADLIKAYDDNSKFEGIVEDLIKKSNAEKE